MLSPHSIISIRAIIILFADFLFGMLAQMASPFIVGPQAVHWSLIEANLVLYTCSCTMFVALMYVFETYRIDSSLLRKESWLRAAAVILLMVVFSGFVDFFFEAQHFWGRRVHVAQWIIAVSLAYGLRILFSIISLSIVSSKKILIIGCGDSGQRLLERMCERVNPDVQIIGFLDTNKDKAGEVIGNVPVYWQKSGLIESVEQLDPDVLIIAMRKDRLPKVIKDIVWLVMRGMEVWDLPAAYEKLLGRIPLEYIDDTWLLNMTVQGGHAYPKVKRFMDVFVALLGLLISAPFVVLAMLAIRLESPGPLILRQKRVGHKGRIITIYKLRSMYVSDPVPGDNGTTLNDVRVTRIGKVVRKLHLDEVPQLVNVLKGELSVVGPRSELAEFIQVYFKEPAKWQELGMADLKNQYVCNYPAHGLRSLDVEKVIPFFEQRFLVAQGITGWAQINAPLLTSSYDDMVTKVEYDLFYVKNISLLLDLTILLETIRIIFWGKGK